MTGEQLLKRAAALISETDTEDYKEIALIQINILLDETWKQNNRMRKAAGKEETGRADLESLGAEIPWEEELVRNALPWGLAAKLFFEEDDNARLSMFNEEFANRLNACDKGLVVLEGKTARNTERYPVGW